MRIVDLDEEHLLLYLVCLEDWSDEIREAGDHKAVWYRRMKDKGLRVKLALDDQGTVGGMIQYIPIEYSPAQGSDLYFINCIWVHGHKQGRGNFQRRGMGMALLIAAEADAQSLGAKGIAAWGIIFPGWMRAGWFKKHGYRVADRVGIQALLWKPFSTEANRPKWVRQKAKPLLEANKVTVTALCNGWCPAQNLVFERAIRSLHTRWFSGRSTRSTVMSFFGGVSPMRCSSIRSKCGRARLLHTTRYTSLSKGRQTNLDSQASAFKLSIEVSRVRSIT